MSDEHGKTGRRLGIDRSVSIEAGDTVGCRHLGGPGFRLKQQWFQVVGYWVTDAARIGIAGDQDAVAIHDID